MEIIEYFESLKRIKRLDQKPVIAPVMGDNVAALAKAMHMGTLRKATFRAAVRLAS